jgi:hypothetical protein
MARVLGGAAVMGLHPWLWWKDPLAQAACGSREQFFVRIASATPLDQLDQLWGDPDFQAVMARVADSGALGDRAIAPR